jgi:hypothetical protein
MGLSACGQAGNCGGVRRVKRHGEQVVRSTNGKSNPQRAWLAADTDARSTAGRAPECTAWQTARRTRTVSCPSSVTSTTYPEGQSLRQQIRSGLTGPGAARLRCAEKCRSPSPDASPGPALRMLLAVRRSGRHGCRQGGRARNRSSPSALSRGPAAQPCREGLPARAASPGPQAHRLNRSRSTRLYTCRIEWAYR